MLGGAVDLTGFDFSTGVFTATGVTSSGNMRMIVIMIVTMILTMIVRMIVTILIAGNVSSSSNNPGRPREQPRTDFMKGARGAESRGTNNLLPPIRQTASIFKQPVTLVKVSRFSVFNRFSIHMTL